MKFNQIKLAICEFNFIPRQFGVKLVSLKITRVGQRNYEKFFRGLSRKHEIFELPKRKIAWDSKNTFEFMIFMN